MSQPCVEDENKDDAATLEHPHKLSKDLRSKIDSTFTCYDLIVQQEAAKEASNHCPNQNSLQRIRELRSKDEDHRIWGYHHFLCTLKEEEETETEDPHSRCHASLQRSNNYKSKKDGQVSTMDCYDLMIKSEEGGGGAMQHSQTSFKYSHSHSREERDGLERSLSQTCVSYRIYSHGGGDKSPKNQLSLTKKKTKSRLAYTGTTCYSLFFFNLLHPLKRLRDQYIKCCFSLAGAGDLSSLVGEGHVVGPLFHEWFPQEPKFGTPRRENTLSW